MVGPPRGARDKSTEGLIGRSGEGLGVRTRAPTKPALYSGPRRRDPTMPLTAPTSAPPTADQVRQAFIDFFRAKPSAAAGHRSEERREGKSVDLGGRRIIK